MAKQSGTTPSGIIQILKSHPDGMSATAISKQLNLPRRTVYNQLQLLKKANKVVNSRPIWIMAQPHGAPVNCAMSLKRNNLHDLSFTIKLISKPIWWDRRENKLIKLKEYQISNIAWGKTTYQQITLDSHIIQLFRNSIIIILRKHYYGNDPYDCFIQGLADALQAYYFIEKLFGFRFYRDGIPQATVRSQHHVKINDIIAKNCLKEGNKFAVYVAGQLRMWVDASRPQGIEAGHKDYAPEDMQRYQDFVADIINNNPPNNTEISNTLKSLMDTQQFYAENIRTHIAAIEQLGNSVQELTQIVKQLKGVK